MNERIQKDEEIVTTALSELYLRGEVGNQLRQMLILTNGDWYWCLKVLLRERLRRKTLVFIPEYAASRSV